MSSETQNLRGNSNPVLFGPFSSNTDSEFYPDYRYIGNQTEETRNLTSCKKDSYAFRNPAVSINVSVFFCRGALCTFWPVPILHCEHTCDSIGTASSHRKPLTTRDKKIHKYVYNLSSKNVPLIHDRTRPKQFDHWNRH